MNKDLIKKCQSIEKQLVKNNSLEYSKLIKELDKNHHFRTDLQHNNAVNWFTNKGIFITTTKNRIHNKNFNDDELNNIKTLLDNNKKEIYLDDIKRIVDKSKITATTRYLEERKRKIIKTKKKDENPSINNIIEQFLKLDNNVQNNLDIELNIEDENAISNEDIKNFEELYINDDDENYSEEDNNANNGYYSLDEVKQYLYEINTYDVLSAEDEYKYAMDYYKNHDQNAKYILITCNLKLVVSVAKRFKGVKQPFMDMIQNGNIGLMTAVDKFNPTLGYKFSTYATWWIRQGIMRGLSNEIRTIRMPAHAAEQALKNIKAKKVLNEKLGRECTEQELVDYINENKILTNSISKMTIENLRLFDKYYKLYPASLSTPVGTDEDSDAELGDFIASEDPSPEDLCLKDDLNSTIYDVLKKVLKNKREYEVILLRFGLKDNKYYTLEEIAKQFGVTRERIRQLESKALRRLRITPYVKTKLYDYANTNRLDKVKNMMKGSY